jgi:hypothetical protein
MVTRRRRRRRGGWVGVSLFVDVEMDPFPVLGRHGKNDVGRIQRISRKKDEHGELVDSSEMVCSLIAIVHTDKTVYDHSLLERCACTR